MSSLPTNRLVRKQLGAWYTPAEIVRPLVEWAIRSPIERVLDPCIGDGHFLIEAAGRLRVLGALGLGAQLHGVDLNPNAVDETHRALARAQPTESPVDLRVEDFFAIDPPGDLFNGLPEVDAVVGNPPYVRYQSFTGARRARALGRARWAGVGLTGLSSSWAAFVVHATSFLRRGGRLALVLPEELLHASYAAAVRQHLRRMFHTTAVIRFDDFVFPDSQERVVLLCASGKDQAADGRLVLASVASPARLADVDGLIRDGETFSDAEQPEKWRPASRDQGTEVLDRLARQGLFVPLREIGKASIGYVSGANDYFVLRPSEAQRLGFPAEVLVPTLIAARQVRGALFSQAEFDRLLGRDERCLLWNGTGTTTPGVAHYIRDGESRGIAQRYKCRVRDPWHVVPGVVRPDALLTYMADHCPRLAFNQTRTTCSNNLLAVQLHKIPAPLHIALVVAFYNSATMLAAERTGRSYGGGVLKLEPSEADRVLVPAPELLVRGRDTLLPLLATIDREIRERRAVEVLSVIDEVLLRRWCGLGEGDVHVIQRTRSVRRLSRKSRRTSGPSVSRLATSSAE